MASNAPAPGGSTEAGFRTTLAFRSDTGCEYLYDDVTGSIFPWDRAHEAVLKSFLDGKLDTEFPDIEAAFGRDETAAAIRLVRHWREWYGAFARAAAEPLAPLSPAEMREHVRNSSAQLLLILTESCNLRCSYCVYSGNYTNYRTHKTRYMTPETACKAIDFYIEFVEPQIKRHPSKRFGITFYGGEALLNAATLRAALEYTAQKYPGLFIPAMTTNGTLLTPENVKLLVKHNVHLAVSVDGPEAEHDRCRRDAAGHGTHARISENLTRISCDYPKYWRDHVVSVSVFDWGTDVEAVDRFFSENAATIPRSTFVNQVAVRNTNYYDRFSPKDYTRLAKSMHRLRQAFKQAKIQGDKTGSYMTSLVGFPMVRILLRQRLRDARSAFLPYTGTCTPGDKIAIQVDGRIDICERVNGTLPLGHIDRGGIDGEAICNVIAQYQRKVLSDCAACPVARLCSICFSIVEENGGFIDPAPLCANVRENALHSLEDYVTIMEANPKADFSFETDTSFLEKRFLVCS